MIEIKSYFSFTVREGRGTPLDAIFVILPTCFPVRPQIFFRMFPCLLAVLWDTLEMHLKGLGLKLQILCIVFHSWDFLYNFHSSLVLASASEVLATAPRWPQTPSTNIIHSPCRAELQVPSHLWVWEQFSMVYLVFLIHSCNTSFFSRSFPSLSLLLKHHPSICRAFKSGYFPNNAFLYLQGIHPC